MDFNSIRLEVAQLAKEVGNYIKAEAENFSKSDVEIKSSNSFVSYVDKEAEKKLVDGLLKIIPEAGFIAEEGTAGNNTHQATWIVDPLDGTTNFIHGIPCFAVSVALQWQNELKVGVVYEISNDECFSAALGQGAFLNEQKIQVSKVTELSSSLIATGFPYYDYSKHQNYLDFMGFLMKKTRGLRRLGSAATDLAYVAAGRFDTFFEYGLNPWDVAAGILLVQEAGGIVSDFSGADNYLFGSEIIASNPNLYNDFTKGLQEHF